MNQPQTPQLDWSTIFTGMIALVIVIGMVRTMGNFLKPWRPPRKHLPKPIAKQVIVPGGSHWTCAKCGKALEPGEKVTKIGKKVYCVECAKKPGSYLLERKSRKK